MVQSEEERKVKKNEYIKKRWSEDKEFREYHSDYSKRYYKRNRDKILRKQKKLNTTNEDEIVDYHKTYYEQNKERLLQYQKDYYEKNKPRYQKYMRKY